MSNLAQLLILAPLLAIAAIADGHGFVGNTEYLATVVSVALLFATGCAVVSRARPFLYRMGSFPAIAACAVVTAAMLVSIVWLVPDTLRLATVLRVSACSFAAILALRVAGCIGDRFAPELWMIVAIVTGLFARVVSIRNQPFDALSDMLPLVDSALRALFSGHSPYGEHLMQLAGRAPYSVPLTYLPLQWLAYAPAYGFGIDLRWTNVAIDAGLALFAFGWLRRMSQRLAPAQRWIAVTAFSAYLLNGYVALRQDVEIFPFTCVLVVLCVAMARGRTLATWIATGAAMAMNPVAAVLAPYLFAHDAARRGFSRAVGPAIAAVFLAALIVLPFLAWDPAGFRTGLVDHWQKLLFYTPAWAESAMRNLNFSVFVYEIRHQEALWLVQFAGCFALFAVCLAWRLHAAAHGAMAFAALTAFFFLAWNVIAWSYLFVPVSGVAIAALGARLYREAGEPLAVETTDPWRKPLIAISAGLAVLSVGGAAYRFSRPPAFLMLLDAPRVELTWSDTSARLACRYGGEATARVRIANRAGVEIAATGAAGPRGSTWLSYHLRSPAGALILQDGKRTRIGAIPPGSSEARPGEGHATLAVPCNVPAGRYLVEVSLFQNDVGWQESVDGAHLLTGELWIAP